MKKTNQSKTNFVVFVSRPFDEENSDRSKWDNFYQKAILPCKEILKQKSIEIVFYNAPSNPGVLDIDEKIPKAIDDCDIFLCVLTEYRPNVLYEAGYAKKCNLPRIYLIEKKYFNKPFPILIGTPDRLYYSEKNHTEIPSKLSQYLIQACELARLRHLELLGKHHQSEYEVKCFKDRESLQLPSKIKSAESSIRILTTNLDYFVKESPTDNVSKLSYLKEASNKGVAIEVLTMNPDANLVIERSKQIEPQFREDVYRYRKELRDGIKKFYKEFQSEILTGKLIFRLYSSLPTQMIYWIDDTIYLSSMASHQRSRDCVHVQFNQYNPGVENTFAQNFKLVKRESIHINQFTWIKEED